MGYLERFWMAIIQKISGIVFIHFVLFILCTCMCPCAMVAWHFQFGMSRCSEFLRKANTIHAFLYLYLHGVYFSWFSMMKPE